MARDADRGESNRPERCLDAGRYHGVPARVGVGGLSVQGKPAPPRHRAQTPRLQPKGTKYNGGVSRLLPVGLKSGRQWPWQLRFPLAAAAVTRRP